MRVITINLEDHQVTKAEAIAEYLTLRKGVKVSRSAAIGIAIDSFRLPKRSTGSTLSEDQDSSTGK